MNLQLEQSIQFVVNFTKYFNLKIMDEEFKKFKKLNKNKLSRTPRYATNTYYSEILLYYI